MTFTLRLQKTTPFLGVVFFRMLCLYLFALLYSSIVL